MSTVLTASSRPNSFQRIWCIWKALCRNPSSVATICPSSPFLTECISDRACIREASRVIELGPGVGGTTESLLDSMRDDAQLMAIEKTESFAEVLSQIDDPRLSVEIADACDLVRLVAQQKFGRADVVVSGVPFSQVPSIDASAIAIAVHDVLRPGGVFIAYQLKSDIQSYARPLFGPAETKVVPLNLPPLRTFVWKKANQRSPTES